MQPRLRSTPRSTGALPRNDRGYWIEQFNEAGVACGLINDMQEVFDEPQVKHLGMVKKVVSTHLGEQTLVGQPVQLERTPSTIARAAPRAANTRRKSSPRSAIDRDDLARMKAAGVY